MLPDHRRLAVALAGVCAFLDLYAPQALLPMLAREFGAGAADVSALISATSLGVAVVAPFTGTVADVLGRKRVIATAMFVLAIPLALIGLADSLPAMVAWRFAQGLMLPPIFAGAVAYISEEWAPPESTAGNGIFITACSFGGFLSRFLTGVLADHFGWRVAFFLLAAATLACAAGVAALLPRERGFVRAESLGSSFRQMLRHLRNPRLIATYAVGFSVLFSFVAIFTYVNFVLAASPFSLSTTALGSIFIVYLLGVAVTPLTVRWVSRLGRRRLAFAVIACWIAGLTLPLAPALPLIVPRPAVAPGRRLLFPSISARLVVHTARSGP